MSRRAIEVVAWLLASLWLVALVGCSQRTATRNDCQLILDRIITIELGEQGYRDPAFAQRKRNELRERLKSRPDGCIGRPLPAHALTCMTQAQNTERLSHDCLR